MAREIDRVGAALDDVAEDDVVDLCGVNAAALDGRGRGGDAEIRGGEVGEGAAQATKGRAGAREDDDVVVGEALLVMGAEVFRAPAS